MNWLFRFFVFLGSLVVIALFSALLAPYFVNWEQFTSEFEKAGFEAGRATCEGGRAIQSPFAASPFYQL